MPARRLAIVSFVLAMSIVASAQSAKWTLGASAMFGQDWLGSRDVRRGGYYSLGYARPEPRFKLWGRPAEMEIESYYMFNMGGRSISTGPDSTHHYGLLMIGRYHQHPRRSPSAYVELGWGLQYSDRVTHGTQSLINSTPMIGFGWRFPYRDYDFVFSIRHFHMSNAGLVGDNQGVNYLQYNFGVRF